MSLTIYFHLSLSVPFSFFSFLPFIKVINFQFETHLSSSGRAVCSSCSLNKIECIHQSNVKF